MFKLFRMFIYLIIIVGVLITFIMWNGGEKIRWFGKKSEEVGRTIKKESKIIGDKSDQLKEKIEDKTEIIEDKVKSVVEKAEKHGIIKREGAGKEEKK